MAKHTEQFRTYANYVRAFAELAGRSPFTPPQRSLAKLAARISANLAAPPQGAIPNLEQVRASLTQAWGTEMILNVTAKLAQEDELVGLSNTWGTVQVYYSLYHGTQALLSAHGYSRPESHPKTQRMFGDLWVMRPLHLEPWSLGVDAEGVRNWPAGKVIDDRIHPWTTCDTNTCWDLAAKAVRTTRDDAVEERLQDIRAKKLKDRQREWAAKGKTGEPARPNLTPAEKQAASVGVRTYSFLDFLYRLRVKSNYVDAAVFVDGPEHPAQSRFLRRDLVYLASSSLLLCELQIEQVVGAATIRAWADDWLAKNHPAGGEMGLKGRRQFL